eukprot:Protomagalhaensia_wolfi_Nauph_80__1274@NODE_1754_length_1359_cov_10_285606_g1365_i0_p1_GENE_NODE_1754_length_1359_cov_10_285606_g1365_i0NODE_1754_length_1359_cov_10_285606_g1365_i0_p1_ORF_typecomplete_len407_score71_31TPR_16/PF13432_6/0_091TPR_16/PF13432_6/0_00027TPR_16/PF13432_6/1_8e02TPR_16/PF13432_6/2_3e06TPR_16/PF13432_6/9_1e05TPR_16/PF13432_6/0_00055TPR_19/PF14559_6/1_7TPR_19/PF14559_6/0_069TPR_19/PF14559_6/66TPR_19/PF14559_6/5_2e05TPR_19/PF14559_6/0_00019TPR_19/PF14559_6/2_7TPR_9/PF13371_6
MAADVTGDPSLHFEKVLSCYQQAQAANSENPAYGAKVAAVLLHQGRLEGACEKLKGTRVSREKSPSDGNDSSGLEEECKDALAIHEIRLRENDFAEVDDITNSLKESAIVRDECIELGNSFYADNRFWKAKMEYSKAIKLGASNPEVWKKRAWCHYWLSEFEDAMTDSISLVKSSPRDITGWLLIGFCHIQLNYLSQAVSSTSRLKFSKRRVDAERAKEHIKAGDRYKYPLRNAAEENKMAIAEYAKAIRIDPFNPDGWKRRGDCYVEQEDFEAALHSCSLDPQDYEAWSQKGYCHRSLQQHSEAIKSFGEAINIEPIEEDYWWSRADSYHKLGGLRSALKDIDHAIELNGDLHFFWNTKGLILEDLGELRKSHTAYKRALELATKQKEPSEYQKSIERVAKKLKL